jgi:hypothetical protein
MTNTSKATESTAATDTVIESHDDKRNQLTVLTNEQTTINLPPDDDGTLTSENEHKESAMKRKIGPLPPQDWAPSNSDSDNKDSEDEHPTKRQRTEEMDPTLQHKQQAFLFSNQENIESDEDTFGPQLPPANTVDTEKSKTDFDTENEKTKKENRERQKREWDFLRNNPGASLKVFTERQTKFTFFTSHVENIKCL